MRVEEFSIDGVNYQIKSECNHKIWPNLIDRVQKGLLRYGKESAKEMVGSAFVEGATKFGPNVVRFTLTINPQGISFG